MRKMRKRSSRKDEVNRGERMKRGQDEERRGEDRRVRE